MIAGVFLLAGCGSGAATTSPSPTTVVAPTGTLATAIATTPGRSATAPVSRPVVSSPSYRGAIASTCRALSRRNSGEVGALLPNYQYNSGVRWGYLGDGEGQTGDPSVLASWLAHANVRCKYYVADVAGHGAVLTSGWALQGGPWAILEFDTYSGAWKLNDFTFGSQHALYQALGTAGTPQRFAGQ